MPMPHSITAEPNALPAGSHVLTLEGAMPAEGLKPGTRIVTRDTGASVLRAVQVQKMPIDAVQVAAGTLGPGRPTHDVVLPARAELLLRGDHALAHSGQPFALVRAEALVDGRRVRALGLVRLRLVHLSFDRRHVVYADGLELASAAPLTEPDRGTPPAASRADPRR
ncbi:Hint domain-containing protein [Thetidibacter halocola]|uniref:Hint domain-containing protein n=1 Tax=Thetidibacter halocola TaxID=2827239 RepID=A0A8J7WAU2_9RHOB|nr:Hint domain-containing protein [Thetidibacter halocola]MBS0124165.1 Hint domain-containing protein [Thetidibacter halocola]